MPLKVGTADFFKRAVSPLEGRGWGGEEGAGVWGVLAESNFISHSVRCDVFSSKLLCSQSPQSITPSRALAAAALRL